jgi:hypothetical protein
MISLNEFWFHYNGFSGPLPDFEGLKSLEILSLRADTFIG